MIVTFKIAILLNLFFIALQDIRERKVYTIALVLLGILLVICRLQTTFLGVFLVETLSNITLVLVLVFILKVYSKYKLKTSLFKVFGLGDLIFFIVISFGFTTLSFYTLFSFSLFFSLLIFMLLKKKLQDKTIPLAGLQSVFFILVFLENWFFHFLIIIN